MFVDRLPGGLRLSPCIRLAPRLGCFPFERRRPRDGIGRFVRVVLPHGGRYLLVARQLGCRFGIGSFIPTADRFQTFGVARFGFLPVIGSVFEVTFRRAPDRRILCG